MTEQIEKDVQRLESSIARMMGKIQSEGESIMGKVVSELANSVERIEKTLLPPTKAEQDPTKK